MGPGWTAARVETLQKLKAQGLNMQYIADAMGVTRNSVIGKLNRLANAAPAKAAPAKAKPAPKRAPKPDPELPSNKHLAYFRRLSDSLRSQSTCRYPEGDLHDRTLKFCGLTVAKRTADGRSPYCRMHQIECYDFRKRHGR